MRIFLTPPDVQCTPQNTTNKQKTRVIEYKDDKAVGKPTKEVIAETEEILQVASIIDRAGLKQLTGALKDIKEIQTTLEAGSGGQVIIIDNIKRN